MKTLMTAVAGIALAVTLEYVATRVDQVEIQRPANMEKSVAPTSIWEKDDGRLGEMESSLGGNASDCGGF